MNLGTALSIGFILGAIGGYVFHGDREAKAMRVAESNYAVCSSALTSNEVVLADVQKALADVRARHDKAMKVATEVLEARDGEIKTLQAAAVEAAASIRKSAHDDANCVDLARMPVCAAIARELWPDATQTRSGRDAR